MPTTNVSRSIASRPSALERPLGQGLLLLGGGVLLAGFHQAWDLSLGLPGHFGLIWMAAIMAARTGSPLPAAALLAALGYAGGGLAFSGTAHHALGHAPAYLAAALIVDLAWRLSPLLVRRPLLAGLTGGLAFTAKAGGLVAAAALFAVEAGALRHGVALPLASHFCFGATGAVIGALLGQAARPRPAD